ncbi:MAG TPA: DUF3027 domain-containing protein [Mycobacteriales bacterium]|nr:DUF3027 domain-containing protein [Mycobacteriales bacterium]
MTSPETPTIADLVDATALEVSPTTAGSLVPDEVAAAAVDVAREAAEQEAPGLVGDHVGVTADEARVATHYFVTLDPAYRGWRWAVTVTRASRSKLVTVDDVVLLPGEEALLAPEWVPWSERLRPGDLGVGDLLPTAADDPRLAPAFLMTDDEEEHDVSFELGLGRERVLSAEGRADAAERWYDGEPGPESAIARAAPAECGSCGFYIPLSGALRQLFGVCANDLAPDDGRVVATDHGCGAHSQAVVLPASAPPPVALSEEGPGYDVVDDAADAAAEAEADDNGSTIAADTVAGVADPAADADPIDTMETEPGGADSEPEPAVSDPSDESQADVAADPTARA